MTFSKIAKFVGIIAFVGLAGYGALVSFYSFSPQEQRPRIVIPLEGLDISFASEESAEVSTSGQKAATGSGISASQSDPEEAAEASPAQADDSQTTSSKVTFSGDLGSLDLAEQGFEEALPEGLEDQVLQASIAQKATEDGGLEEIEKNIPKVDCERDREALERYTNIGQGEKVPQYPINRIYDLRQEGKIEEINQIIENYKGSVERNAAVSAPESMAFHYRVKLTLFEKLVQKLEEVRDAPKGKSLTEIYPPSELKTHIFVMTLLEEVINSVCENCGLNTAQCKA